MIGATSEELAKEAFSRMDVQLDLNMTMISPLNGLKQVEYLRDVWGHLQTPGEASGTRAGQPGTMEEG